MQKENSAKQQKVDFIVGVIVFTVAMALLVWLIIGFGRALTGGNKPINSGVISAEGDAVRGTERIYTYTPDGNIPDGAEIVWYVDGERVEKSTYTDGQPLTLHYTPQHAGQSRIEVAAGNYAQSLTETVYAPHLTITAPNLTITYGDEMPQLLCTAEGFVGNEGADFCSDCCQVEGADKVGVYRIAVHYCNENYQTECIEGTLTVLPRRLTVDNCPEKVYDGNGVLCAPTLQIGGVLAGDDVSVQCDNLYFDNKNVGENKQVLLTATLVGADAENYLLPDFAQGRILPKSVSLQGLTVQNKLYDGTTKATVDNPGTLVGVCEGDSVAIGRIDVSFDNAEAGTHQVNVNSITLVGADKDNYTVDPCQTNGEIQPQGSLWDRLFGEPVAQTQK